MAFGFISIVHAVAAVFAIIELGLTGYVASRYDSWYGFHGYAPSRVNFMIFNSVWSLLVLAYVGITPIYLTSIFHKLAAFALNVITALFWFAGSIALAVWAGVGSCGADTFCGSARAACAFGFFLWAIFTFLTVLDGLESFRGRGIAHKPNANPGV